MSPRKEMSKEYRDSLLLELQKKLDSLHITFNLKVAFKSLSQGKAVEGIFRSAKDVSEVNSILLQFFPTGLKCSSQNVAGGIKAIFDNS